MNILLVSESFILREYMENLFHEIIKDAQVNVKIRLSETTKEDLLQTDFVFIDIYDEISKELKIIDYIKIKNKKLKTIVIDRNKNKSTFKKVLKYGIEGYITNLVDKEEFIFNIKKILNGKKAYETDLVEIVVNDKINNQLNKLTRREQEVLKEISKGLNNKEIADNLFITECTVKKHISNIFQKLNFRNRQEAIIYTSNKK